jgi:GTPase
VVMDCALSPVQQRNLEKAFKAKVIDRTGLILEIFGRRARTSEGVLQVELAHLAYQKSRLVRSWTHLERQRGGFGFLGGPGETQIETDRRLIQERMIRIERDLEGVKKTRALHRASRSEIPYPIVALVGYTNAGKSTLFNALTEAGVLESSRMFATLDPKLSQLQLPSRRKVLLSDTVGFIRNLPHTLVTSFRATLEEVERAELLLHVRDASSPMIDEQKLQVERVLGELEVTGKPVIEVLNKVDLLTPEERAILAATEGPRRVAVSGLKKLGLQELLGAIDAALVADPLIEMNFRLPQSEGAVMAALEAGAIVEGKRFEGNLAYMTARGPASLLNRYRRFQNRA